MEAPGPSDHFRANEDAQNLRLLSVFHYLMAGLATLGAFIMAAYFALVGYIVTTVVPTMPSGGSGPHPSAPPAGFAWFFGAFGVLISLLPLAFAVLHFLCGRWLAARRNRSFCFVVGCVSCIGFPLGTVLGVFTILVLQRPSVIWLFNKQTPGAYLNR